MGCPLCGLFNPPEAQRGDCGYSFTNRAAGARLLEDTGKWNMGLGALMFVMGLVITVGTYGLAVLAAEGLGIGIYVIFWGGGLYGPVLFLRGLRQYRNWKRAGR